MNQLLHDLAYAWRNLWKQPATSLLIIATLALGIGVNTAMFSMTWHVLLAPLPYEDGDRLVKLEQLETENPQVELPWALTTLTDLRAQNTVFSSVLQYFQESYPLYRERGAFQANAGVVDGNFFSALGIAPALGRLLVPEDDKVGAAPVMVLGNEFWRNEFGGDADVLGSVVEMQGISYTVIGVLPDVLPYPRANDVWVPAATDWVMSNSFVVKDRSNSGLLRHVIGKLDDGVSLEQARQHLRLFAGRLSEAYPDVYRAEAGYTVVALPLKDTIAGPSSRTVSLLMSLAALVVLIACVNFANLTLAGIMRRSQELAVREAVGADPGVIKRLLITENLVVSAIGGLVGLGMAALMLGFVAAFAAVYTPLATEISLDGHVLWFCLGLTLALGLASALIASSQSRDINRALKESGSKATASAGAKQLRDALLATQCALAFVMLASTALMASSLYRLANQPTGYDMDGVVVLRMVMRGMNLSTMWTEQDMMWQVLDETRALPGVTAAGLFGRPLLEALGFPDVPDPISIETGAEDGGDRTIRERFTIASEGLFDAMSIPLLAGRSFMRSDDRNAPKVVLINDSFARRHFPAGDALGQRLSFDSDEGWMTIVGIVGDIRARGIDTADTAMVYTNYGSSPTQLINLYVKTNGDWRQTADAVAAIVQRHDPLQPIDSITSLDEVKDQWLVPTRLRTGLIAAFGVLALLVTLSGVIGVVSYNISQRVREIGVHMAVGASPRGILRLFIGQGLKIYLLGLSLGLALMFLVAPLVEPLLYETPAFDIRLYCVSALVLSLAVLVALYLPARKASRMNPTAALHTE
jgi:predicted permease